jgi:hypothetical protein
MEHSLETLTEEKLTGGLKKLDWMKSTSFKKRFDKGRAQW